MANDKGFFGKLIDKIGDIWEWFESLFDAAEKAWDKLDKDVQEAMKQGADIINTLRFGFDLAPDSIFEYIQNKFPSLTEEKLRAALEELALAFNIPIDADLVKTIQNLQEYLKTKVKDDSVGDAILSTSAQILSIALAPDKTPFAKIGMLIEFVYRKFIKKD